MLNLGKKLALAFFTLALTLMTLEIGCRIKAWRDDLAVLRAYADLAQATPPIALPADRDATLREIICPTRNPRRIYQLVAGLNTRIGGQPLNTDQQGLRVMPAPPPGLPKVRIKGLGDSVMFGWGVADDATYIYHLQHHLQQAWPDVGWQVDNLAVPGYNTVMEVEAFRDDALENPPDLVVIEYVSNDLDLPNFIISRENYGTLRKSFLLEYILLHLKHRQRAQLVSRNIKLRGAPKRTVDRFVNDPQVLPPHLQGMVGVKAYQAAIRHLARLAQRHNFQLVMLAEDPPPEHVRQVCAQCDIPLVETAPTTARYLADHNLPMASMVLSAQDLHPSPLAHQVVAGALFDYLQNSGTLSNLASRSLSR